MPTLIWAGMPALIWADVPTLKRAATLGGPYTIHAVTRADFVREAGFSTFFGRRLNKNGARGV